MGRLNLPLICNTQQSKIKSKRLKLTKNNKNMPSSNKPKPKPSLASIHAKTSKTSQTSRLTFASKGSRLSKASLVGLNPREQYNEDFKRSLKRGSTDYVKIFGPRNTTTADELRAEVRKREMERRESNLTLKNNKVSAGKAKK